MDKAEEFLASFKSLLASYHCGLYESDQYDGEEELVGTTYYLTFVDDSTLDAAELSKMIENIGKPYA